MALKLRQMLVNCFTMPVGATAITNHSVAKLASSLLVVATASTEETAFFILAEGMDVTSCAANREALCAGVGSIVLVRAHDNAITEGQHLVPAAAGRVDGIATLTTATQYVLGKAMMAAGAQDQLIPMLYCPFIATKAAA